MGIEQMKVALGKEPADLILRGGRVIHVFTGEISPGDVAIKDGKIAGVGFGFKGVKEIDVTGKIICPGLIDAHCHVESSMVTPETYCLEVALQGTTTVITDPHEIANVSGIAGIEFMLEASEKAPLNYFVQLPSCVPATPFESSGAILEAGDLKELLSHPRVLGLGEVMNSPGVFSGDRGMWDKLSAFSGKIIDGHAPGMTGPDLTAYAAAGIHTDHESMEYQEALEKLRNGIAVLVREGGAAKNLDALIGGFVDNNIPTHNAAFCTDDVHLSDVRIRGTIRNNLAKAVALGLPVIDAVRMATINAAQIFRLHELGAICPNYQADIVIFDDLKDFNVHRVFHKGIPVSREAFKAQSIVPENIRNSIKLPAFSLKNPFPLPATPVQPIIEIIPHQITTAAKSMDSEKVAEAIKTGKVRKIAVIERHHATGNMGVGLISGYGLTSGAVATTVAHDSHNLLVLGDNDEDMLLAVKELQSTGGGYVLVQSGKVKGLLPLPIGGLMSPEKGDKFIRALDKMLATAYEMGVSRDVDPFTTLSFMALPVIGDLRLTDKGMFDVTTMTFC